MHHKIDGTDPVRVIDLQRARRNRKIERKAARTLGVQAGDGDPIRIFEEQLRTAEGDFHYWRDQIIQQGAQPLIGTLDGYLLAADRLTALARSAISANIDERRVRIQEAQLVLAARVIMAVLTHPDIGLSLAQLERARVLAVEQARILEGQP